MIPSSVTKQQHQLHNEQPSLSQQQLLQSNFANNTPPISYCFRYKSYPYGYDPIRIAKLRNYFSKANDYQALYQHQHLNQPPNPSFYQNSQNQHHHNPHQHQYHPEEHQQQSNKFSSAQYKQNTRSNLPSSSSSLIDRYNQYKFHSGNQNDTNIMMKGGHFQVQSSSQSTNQPPQPPQTLQRPQKARHSSSNQQRNQKDKQQPKIQQHVNQSIQQRKRVHTRQNSDAKQLKNHSQQLYTQANNPQLKKPVTPLSISNVSKKRPIILSNNPPSAFSQPKTSTAASIRSTSGQFKQVFRFDNQIISQQQNKIRPTSNHNNNNQQTSYRISTSISSQINNSQNYQNSNNGRSSLGSRGAINTNNLQSGPFSNHQPASMTPQSTKNSRIHSLNNPDLIFHQKQHQLKLQNMLSKPGSSHQENRQSSQNGRVSSRDKSKHYQDTKQPQVYYSFSKQTQHTNNSNNLHRSAFNNSQNHGQSSQNTSNYNPIANNRNMQQQQQSQLLNQKRGIQNQQAKGDSAAPTPQDGMSTQKPRQKYSPHKQVISQKQKSNNGDQDQKFNLFHHNHNALQQNDGSRNVLYNQRHSSQMGDFNPNFSGVGGGVAAAKSTSHTHMISQKPIPRGKLQIEIPIDDQTIPTSKSLATTTNADSTVSNMANSLMSPQNQSNFLINKAPNSTTNAQTNNMIEQSRSGPNQSAAPHPTIQTQNPPNFFKMAQFKSLSTRNSNFDALTLEQQQSLQRQLQQQLQKNTITNPPPMPLQPASKIIIPNHQPTKCSLKRNGVVRAYAANTNQGLVRNYNEDRVSIILNILKPPSRSNQNWPKCSFFGVYDGHGGSTCADFLRDNLHQFVIKESSFPWNPKDALRNGFANAEKTFLMKALTPQGVADKSGSCGLVVLIVGDMCYVANVGDSRALLSGDGGQRIFPLTRDHKPTDQFQRKRIVQAGGQIYQTATATPKNAVNPYAKKQIIVGPHRVLPGRLSVCRTFGDVEAKQPRCGGNPNVVIATPQIKSFKITKDHDFIVMSSEQFLYLIEIGDGVFDKLTNKQSIQCVWNSVRQSLAPNIHQQCGLGVEYILKNSLVRRTLDNVTCVIVGFYNLKRKMIIQAEHNCKSKAAGSESKTNSENVNINQGKTKNQFNIIEEDPDNLDLISSSSAVPGLEQGEETKPQHQHSPLSGVTKASIAAQIPATTSNALKKRKHFDFSEAAIQRHNQKEIQI